MNALAQVPVAERNHPRKLPAPVIPRVDDICLDNLMQAPSGPQPKTMGFQLGQSWLPSREPAFRPGTVWLAATDNTLMVCADLTDDCVRTFAYAANQPMWDLGDTFCFFLQSAGCERYFEFQIAPKGSLPQLRHHSIAIRANSASRVISCTLAGSSISGSDNATVAGAWSCACPSPTCSPFR